MAYVGTPIDTTNQFQSLQGKRFSGNGSATAFTLDIAPSSVFDIEVFVENVRQDPNSAYTLSGTTLTFTGAPASGTNNIYVIHQAKAVGTIDLPEGALVDLNGGSDKLVLDADGDTTISADTDDQIDFKVAGNDRVKLDNTDLTLQTCALRINNSTTGTTSSDGLLLEVSGSEVYFNQKENADIHFRTNNTDRVTIPGGGGLLVGTTTSSATVTLETSSLDTNTINVRNTNSTRAFPARFQMTTDHNNETSEFLSCLGNTTARLKIFANGDVENSNNNYSAFSDEKLKEQIADASSQWDDIKNLKVRKYKMKDEVAEGDSDDLWRLGVVAQELETVSPSLVVTHLDEDLEHQPILDKDGKQTSTKSVKYSILYMKAVKALQEAMTKIEDLETRVKTLEG